MPGYVGFLQPTVAVLPATAVTALEAQPNILTAEAIGDLNETGYGLFESATAAVNESLVHVESIDRGTSTGGTFVITVDGEDSGALEFDTNAATIETDVEAITGVTAVDCEGTGTVADPWIVTFVDKGPKVISVDGASLTGGDATATTVTTTLGVDGVAAADTAITYDTLVGTISTDLPVRATIGSEIVEITSYTATVLTVVRGVGGTVAADHADSLAIAIHGQVLASPEKVVFRVQSEDQVAKAWTGVLNDGTDIDDADTSIIYDGGSGTKPTVPFIIKIDDERMHVTVDNGTTTYTVVRGFGGTTAILHLDEAVISTDILAADIVLAATAVTGLEAASGYPASA